MPRKHEGIEVRHERGCRSSRGGRCSCSPSYRAAVWSGRERKLVRRTFGRLSAAKAWRADAQVALRQGTLRTPSRTRLDDAASAWLAGARDGSIRNRSGDPYKPSVIRSYEEALRLRVLPELGHYWLSDLRIGDVQDFVDRLVAERISPSTIRNTLMPLRAIYRRAVARGIVGANPTAGVELPAARGKRERIVPPEQASALLEALPVEERALWATALYAGLRLGELQALAWSDVDLGGGVIRVRRSWDQEEGAIEPKSRAGRRSVPIAAVLRDFLTEHRIRVGDKGLVFARTDGRPFNPSTVYSRARRAWKAVNDREREAAEGKGRKPILLAPITPHEARHTFASLMIAAGVNGKALSTYLGHSSIQVTFDRYGHLMPGNEEEAAALLDAYLEAEHERAAEAARAAVPAES